MQILSPDEQNRLAANIATSLKEAQPCIVTRVLESFNCLDTDLTKKLKDALGIVDPADDAAAAPVATSNDNNNRKK